MGHVRSSCRKAFLFSFLFLAGIVLSFSVAAAASVTLTWQDNSTDEDGFKIERSVTGTYGEIASVGPNTQTYTDTGLLEGTTYCYRVRSFNSTGISDPSNESCATIPITTFGLSLTKAGTGSGSVTSSPAGILCGSDCSEDYPSETVVSLTATAASGSIFSGWSGDADCADGVVTMNGSKSCTATFDTSVTASYTLTVNINAVVSSEGTGSGSVTSNPAGINCGSDCSETYSSGTVVSLTATPASGSSFAGWSGGADCQDGKVTLNGNTSCTASFELDTAVIDVARNGNGMVTSSPSGISCGTECSKSYLKGTQITLKATPAPGTKFSGWSGGGCQGTGDCTVNLDSSTVVTATFVGHLGVGIFRPSTGEWYLDANANGIWEGCSVDLCLGSFGASGDLPVIGDWTGSGRVEIGVFNPSTAEWRLDLNGNGQWDGCEIDRCLRSARPQASLPIAGDWIGSGFDMIGEMLSGRTRGRQPRWYLDLNGDGIVDNCNVDACLKFSSGDGDLPVAGDWSGNNISKIGIFRPAKGEWFLDLDGDGEFANCRTDKCVKSFGANGDYPVIGDWSGTGKAQIGVFRLETGEWFLDVNGNGQWDGCGVDGCLQFLEHKPGDLPVVGAW